MKFPFIVFEGPDAVNKVKIANLLADKLGTTLYRSIPSQMLEARKAMEASKDPAVSLGFFTVCNLLRSAEVKQQITQAVVVQDRYFFSHVIYHRLALKQPLNDLINDYVNNSTYEKPNIVILVTQNDTVFSSPVLNAAAQLGDAIQAKRNSMLFSHYTQLLTQTNTAYLVLDTSNKTIDDSLDTLFKDLTDRNII